MDKRIRQLQTREQLARKVTALEDRMQMLENSVAAICESQSAVNKKVIETLLGEAETLLKEV